MAARTVEVTYLVLELVDATPGEWCPHCALPSAAKITLAQQVELNGVVGDLKLSTGIRCMDGHGWLTRGAL